MGFAESVDDALDALESVHFARGRRRRLGSRNGFPPEAKDRLGNGAFNETPESSATLSPYGYSQEPENVYSNRELDFKRIRYMRKSEIWQIVEYLEWELRELESKLKSQMSKEELERERIDQEWATVTAKFNALRKAHRARK